jgi:hypothetical protein
VSEAAVGRTVRCPVCGARFEAGDDYEEVMVAVPRRRPGLPPVVLGLLIAGGAVIVAVFVVIFSGLVLKAAADREKLADPVLKPEKMDFTAEELHRLHFNDHTGDVRQAFFDKSISLTAKEVTVTGYLRGPITQDTMIIGESETGYGISSKPGGKVLVWCGSPKSEQAGEAFEAADGSLRRVRGECWGGDRLHRQVTLRNCSIVP